MDISVIVWETVVRQLTLELLKKSSKGIDFFIKKQKLKGIKRKFISRVDKDILYRYGDRTFYTKLSRCLFINESITLIFERCFERDFKDNLNDREFISKLLNTENWEGYELEQVYQITKHILDSMFVLLNKPNTESERKNANLVLNGFTELGSRQKESFNDVLEGLQEIKTSIDQNSARELFANPLMNLVNSEEYEIQLNAKHVKDNFRYDIWIELTPEISKFNTLSDYIEYVNFCGEVKEINVLQVEIFDSKSCLLRKPVANVKIKPMIFLGSYFSGSINLSTLTQLDNLDHLTLRITPPQTILEVDIEDSIGKKILTNLNFKISRKVLLDHEVEIILRDEDSNPDVFIELCMILLQNKVNKSVFRIKMKDFNSPHSRYAFYDYADRMNSSNSLKIRDIHSKIILLTAQSTISMDNVGDIKSMVDFYRKVIYLQDQFNVRFDMPGTIYDDEVRRVDSLCELISRGYVLEQIKGFNFDTENIVLGDFERLSEQKTPTLFQCNFVYIKLFNCNLNFEKNLICIVPRALITKSRNNGYDLIPQTKVLLIFEPIYGEFNVFEVIKKHGLV